MPGSQQLFGKFLLKEGRELEIQIGRFTAILTNSESGLVDLCSPGGFLVLCDLIHLRITLGDEEEMLISFAEDTKSSGQLAF